MWKCVVQFLVILISILAITAPGHTGTRPQVTRVDAVYVDAGASMRIQWHSEEPVMKAYISIGTERRTVEIDFRDNRRNPSGFSGEATALVPMAPGMGGASAYTVQVEDEFRTKSELVTGVIAGQRQQGMQPPDDNWGHDRLSRPSPGLRTGAPGQPGIPQGGMMPYGDPGMMPPPMGGMTPPPAMFPPPQMQGGMAPPPMPMNQGMAPPPLPMNPAMAPPPPPVMPTDPNMMAPPPPPPPMPVDPGMMPPPPPPPPPMPPVQ